MTMPKSQLRFRGKNISKNLILKICPKFSNPNDIQPVINICKR